MFSFHIYFREVVLLPYTFSEEPTFMYTRLGCSHHTLCTGEIILQIISISVIISPRTKCMVASQ